MTSTSAGSALRAPSAGIECRTTSGHRTTTGSPGDLEAPLDDAADTRRAAGPGGPAAEGEDAVHLGVPLREHLWPERRRRRELPGAEEELGADRGEGGGVGRGANRCEAGR